MSMENKDLQRNEELEIKTKIKNAIESGDSDAFVEAQMALAKSVEKRVLDEAKRFGADLHDQSVLAKRGMNPLTKEERQFYNEVIGGEGFSGVEKLMPPTIFNRVFEELRQSHPLLSQIDFVNTTATTEWIMRNGDVEAAWWGALTDAIQKKLSMTFRKESTELYKLSAYVPVAKSMLDLGPEWLDRFVRQMLAESIAIALEAAIINGTGNGQPIGMLKDLDGPVTGGEYPDKAATPLNDLKPKTLGTHVMAPLTKNGKRSVSNVLMVVNPLDYWSKIFPGTTVLTANGAYVYGVLPIPATIVQSVAVPEGKMIAGLARDYFMGIGSSQRIEYSDHYRFLEDERTYITKQYANGRPLDNESFLVFDISGMEVDDGTGNGTPEA